MRKAIISSYLNEKLNNNYLSFNDWLFMVMKKSCKTTIVNELSAIYFAYTVYSNNL